MVQTKIENIWYSNTKQNFEAKLFNLESQIKINAKLIGKTRNEEENKDKWMGKVNKDGRKLNELIAGIGKANGRVTQMS